MSQGLVKSLITCLTDRDMDVIIEASSALRSLANTGSRQVLTTLYDQDVLTPLTMMFPKARRVSPVDACRYPLNSVFSCPQQHRPQTRWKRVNSGH
jgi:hypothetical protein